jgi:hypothetical protein
VFVEFAESIEDQPPILGRHAGGIAEVQHRVAAGTKPHTLMLRREEARAPQVCHQRLASLVFRDEHYEGRQIVVAAAESVIEPRADARSTGNLRSRLHERRPRSVIDRLGVHRADDAEFVGHFRRVRQQLAERLTGLTMLLELERRTRQRDRTLAGRHPGEPLCAAHRIGKLSAVVLHELRLGVKEIKLRGRAGLEQVDHAFGLGREVVSAESVLLAGHFLSHRRLAEQVGERHSAETQAESVQTFAAAEVEPRFSARATWMEMIHAGVYIVMGGCVVFCDDLGHQPGCSQAAGLILRFGRATSSLRSRRSLSEH